MTTPVIMDIVVAAVLLLFVIFGWQQGFVKSLAGLIITIAALVGAAIIAGTFADPAARLVAPLIEHVVEEKVEDALSAETGIYDMDRLDGSADEVLRMLGIDADARESIAEQAEATIAETGATVVSAVIQSLARSVIYGILFVLGFVALSILLNILAAAMDLLTKLPGLHIINAVSGAVLGLVKGALVVFLGIWFLRRLGVSFETAAVGETYLLKFFAANTPLSVLALLQ
ncbi:MAG: CvpA family protein [Oscillibacter sp.]|nr:CvpA family protein [Oscillibacter sp.]